MSFKFRFQTKESHPSSATIDEVPECHEVNRGLWKARWTALVLMGLTVSGSSCSSASKYVQNVFQKDPPVAAAETPEGEVKHAYTSGKSSGPKIETLGQSQMAVSRAMEDAASPQAENAPVAEQNPSSEQADVQALVANGEDPFASGDSLIQQTSSSNVATKENDAVQKAIDEAVGLGDRSTSDQAASENRRVASAAGPFGVPASGFGAVATDSAPAASCPPVAAADCPPCQPGAARPFPNLGPNKDEFVCDGGDHGLPVHYKGTERGGLDLEDTVAEYKDDSGRARVTPSTQACIYAPRFGSVSSATLPEEGLQVEKVAGHQDQTSASGMLARTVIDEQRQADESRSMLTRSRPSAVEAAEGENHLHKAMKPENHVKLVGPREDFRFLQEGQFDSTNSAVIARGVNAAQEWADGRRPIIVAKDTSGQIVQGRFTAQDYTGVEDRRTPGELRLVKVADKASAHPGDIVTFTIRFDNVGGRDLTSLRVVDNLSPRLEYVENSIQSDREGSVNVEDNGFGGKLLTFEFDEPLKGQTGGFISFQCRVR